MTAQEFMEKFPDQKERNENCLLDMACPHCGGRGPFNISFRGTCTAYDSGTDDTGDHEWDNYSDCGCRQCGHYRSVKHFKVEGLDAALEEAKEEATNASA
jgi:hypothetical protein